MKCPYCNLAESKVVNSRSTSDELSIRRRRECLSCGQRFTTYETIKNEDIIVIKKNGTRQTFDRNKIIDGVVRACYKRPVPTEKIEEVANQIEKQLINEFAREVTTEKIGSYLMEEIKKLDKIAYIRFASVYLSFDDIDVFAKEVKKVANERK